MSTSKKEMSMEYTTYTIKVEANSNREGVISSLFENLSNAADDNELPQPGEKSTVTLRDEMTDELLAKASVEVREGVE